MTSLHFTNHNIFNCPLTDSSELTVRDCVFDTEIIIINDNHIGLYYCYIIMYELWAKYKARDKTRQKQKVVVSEETSVECWGHEESKAGR